MVNNSLKTLSLSTVPFGVRTLANEFEGEYESTFNREFGEAFEMDTAHRIWGLVKNEM